MGARKSVTQKDRVLRYMKVYGPISHWTASKEFGNYRLAATIHQLKKDGHKIEKTMHVGENRFGEKIKFAKYNLVD